MDERWAGRRHDPALIFDFGNVVAHFDYARAGDVLGRPLGLSGPAFLERVQALGFSPLVRQYECGQISAQAFWNGLRELAGLEIPYAEFAAAWSDIFWLNRSVARLVEALKHRGYTLVLGSNTNDLHASWFRRQFAETLTHFDALVLSYEIGHVKPSSAFYQACAQAAGRPASACVFIDDLAENVEGARRAGLTGLLYHDTPSLIAALRALGVEVPARRG